MSKKKESKKSKGKTFDTVNDYIDIVSHMIVEYFNKKYKIEKKVEDIKKATMTTLYSLKKEFIKTIIESLFLATGIFALILGSILFVSKFVALEYLLIFYGLIVTIIVLLRLKVDV